jgi:hypothetical protein
MSLWGPGYFSNRRVSGYGPSLPWNALGLRIENVGNPEEGGDATTKDYVSSAGASKTYIDGQDALRVMKTGDTMTGNLRLSSTGTDPVRLLGCTDLTSGKGFSIAFGNIQNQLQFTIIPAGQTQTPLTLETTHGLLVRSAGQDVCQLGSADASPMLIIHKDIAMNSHKIKYLPTPTNNDEAATKGYVDGVHSRDVYIAAAPLAPNAEVVLVLSPVRTPCLSEEGSAGSILLIRGLYKFIVIGTCSNPTAIPDIFLYTTSVFRRYTIRTPEFDFTTATMIDGDAEIRLGAQRTDRSEATGTATNNLNIEATLIIERL